jgi:4-amino-4-deoxy-L-arabinose transferase-like glycosyltransferase
VNAISTSGGALAQDPLSRFWRPGATDASNVRIDLLWLLGLGLLLVGVGLGLRDPWPADEPRFALVALDMVRSGLWLFPQVGADWYPDKPPVFFWMIATCYELTGSLRLAFLLPSLFAALATVVLVYDIARRLWTREIGFAAGWLLLVTFQFVWQGRQAQIDAVLCFWTTLSLYCLLRHLLLGPQWGWYALGWAAAGFGVITKGVGFLPLLVLIVFAILRRLGWVAKLAPSRGKWSWGPLAFLAAVSTWLVPMLLSANTPELIAYRDEILFNQTVNRYAAAWHHHEPFWYYVVQVMPPLWLPLSALIPWLWPRWRKAWQAKDVRTVLPLLWVLAVTVFFSASPGKRGVYILPALPALVIAAAPFLSELFALRGPKRVFLTLGWVLAAVGSLGAIYLLAVPAMRAEVLTDYGIDGVAPLAAVGLCAIAACAVFRAQRAQWAYLSSLAALLIVVGVWISPAINADRSGAKFIEGVQTSAIAVNELGLVSYKEQYLLEFDRPTINFGHARWREGDAEAFDAAAWLMAKEGRALMVPSGARERCFTGAQTTPLGHANSTEWFLVTGSASPDCVAAGRLTAARPYIPKSH